MEVFQKKNKKQNNIQKNIITKFKSFSRQALHSKTLTFKHPISKKNMYFDCDLPNDMNELINSIT